MADPELPPEYTWYVNPDHPSDTFLKKKLREGRYFYVGVWSSRSYVVDLYTGQTLSNMTREEGLAYLAQLAWLGEI